MTIVAAFRNVNGAVLCADSEETVANYAKNKVEKICADSSSARSFSFGISAAGSGHYADMLTQDLRLAILRQFTGEYDPEGIIELIKQKVQEFHVKHVWPRGPDFGSPIEMLVVLHPHEGGVPLILQIAETAVNPICWTNQDRKCIGIGAYLADYILAKLFSHYGSRQHLIALAAYTLKEVRENIAGCGKDSHIFLFCPNKPFEQITEEQIHYIEQANDGFEDVFRDVFDFATNLENPQNPTPDDSQFGEEVIEMRRRHESALQKYRDECLYWKTHDQ